MQSLITVDRCLVCQEIIESRRCAAPCLNKAGININQTKFETGNYNSFKLVNNKETDINRILEYLLYCFDGYYKQIVDPNSKLQNEFDNYLYRKNEMSNFKTKNENKFKAKIKGTSPEGKLILTLENGRERSFNHKEIFFI